MKKFGLFLCLSLLFAFAGCDKDETEDPVANTQLAKPEVSIASTTESSFKVVWEAVADAEGYKYQLAQEGETGEEIPVIAEQTTSATALSFDDLEPETKYILRVKAYAGGMEDSAYCKIFATTLAEEREPLTFTSITVSDVTYESATVELVPAAEDLYYYAVIEYSQFENKSDAEIISALKSGITASSLVSGRQTKTVHGLKESTKYQVVAFGWNADEGKATSDVSHLEEAFTTEADTRLSIEIGIGSVTDQEATVTYTPTPSDGTYFADVIEASLIAGKSDMEIVSYLQTEYADNKLQDIRYTGTKSKTYQISASTDYVAVAFAYDTEISELTSLMFTQAFSSGMLEGDSVFTIALSNPTESTFDYDITSSKPDMYYMELYIPTMYMSQINEETEAAGIVQELNALCLQYAAYGGFDFVAEALLDKGNVHGTMTGLDAETEYTLIVVGIAKVSNTEVKTCTTFAYSKESITTTAPAPAAEDVWVDMKAIYGTFTDGSYALGAELIPNEQAKSVWTYTVGLRVDATSLEELGYTESELRSTLLAEGEEIEATEGKYQAAYAVSPNQVLLITTLGKNAEGAAGNLNWMIIKAGSAVGGKPTILGQSDKNGSGGSTGGGDEEEPVNIAYSDYLGEWTLTSSGRFVLTDTGVSGSEEPVTFNLRIEQNVENQDYKVYGWNSDTEFANAHPFIAEYDPTEEGGISGWMNINLAQVLYTEGNIDWTLCPRFIAAQSYYYYSNTDMDMAFYGAILDGTGIILGNKFKFEAPIGEVQMMAMSVFGLDRTDEDADPLSLANETIHAVQPFYLTKAGASTTARKGLSSLQKSNINRLVATHQAFAQFSKAATLGKPYKRLLELAQNMPIVFNGPARKIEQPAFTKELGSGIKVNLHRDELR